MPDVRQYLSEVEYPCERGELLRSVSDLTRAVDFWTAALHLVAGDEWAGDHWRTLDRADGSGRALGPMISTPPVEQVDSAADPEGNRFCVVDLSNAPSGS